MNIENVVNFILEQEMPLLCGVDPAYVRKQKALLGILASSVPYGVDITKLAGIIGLTRNSVIAYLQNPNLLYAIASTSVQIGTVRKTFVLSQLSVNHEVECGKTQGDFVLADNIEYATGKKLPLWIVGLTY